MSGGCGSGKVMCDSICLCVVGSEVLMRHDREELR